MKTVISFCVFIFLLATGCNPPAPKAAENVVPIDILAGKWADLSQSRHFMEEWYVVDENHLRGKGFVMANNDTVFIEMLEIESVDGVLTYSARVPGQNNNATIAFGITENRDNKMVFENPRHDFPQKIIYDMQTRSTMHVYIEGYENGVFRTSRFIFEKLIE